MRRASTIIIVYLLLMSSSAVMLDNAGFSDALGSDIELSSSKHLEDAAQAADDFSLEGGFLETLFGIYDAAYSTVAAIVTGVYAGPEMMLQVGIPPVVTGVMTGGVLLIILGIDTIYAASGREM